MRFVPGKSVDTVSYTLIFEAEAAFGVNPSGLMTFTSQDPAAAPKSRVQVILVGSAVTEMHLEFAIWTLTSFVGRLVPSMVKTFPLSD